jgi:cell division protein FtsI (penicillin-binding protein 3)
MASNVSMHTGFLNRQGRLSASRAVPLRAARFWVLCLFFTFWAFAITGRLFWLQVVRHKEFVERAQKQQQRTFEIAPRRGVLYDRNLRELAMTVQADSIYAVPTEIENKAAAAHALAAIVHSDPEDNLTTEPQIAERLVAGHAFAWVARRVTAQTAASVKALNMKGIYFQKEYQRVYPDNQIAAQVLGYVGVDDNGLGGLEQKFEPQLHGVPGRVYTAMDARRHWLGSTEHDPEPGQNLVLTIDENIQFIAERALDNAMQRTHADIGTVVIQDVHTGQILALAIRPTFDPNQSRHTTSALLKNHAVSDVYEPGSVFKLVTYSSALENHVASPDDMIDCQGGQITLFGRTIHDDKSDRGMGVVTVATALARSSDVAAVKLALKVGEDRFSQIIRDFGFGSRTGVEMPGETRGLLRPVKKWGPTSIGSIAIGQEVGVTPLQMVSMVSTIANGGTYLPPHILMPAKTGAGSEEQMAAAAQALDPQPFKPGEELPNPLPAGAHRVISEMTAAQMRKMMEGVVLFGTGKPAQLNGYSSGGKTGTAQKVDPVTHLYSKSMHIASFAGIAPVNNPVISVAVVMDNPKGASYYGTAVSAPVFAEVAQQVLEYLGVPHDIEVRAPRAPAKPEKPVVEDADDAQDDVNALFAAVNDLPADDPLRAQPAASAKSAASTPSSPVATASLAASAPSEAASAIAGAPPAAIQVADQFADQNTDQSAPVQTARVEVVSDEKRLKVPSLVGLPLRKVIEVSAAAGLAVHMTGSGTAREQAPAAGTMVPAGTEIVVRCAR